MQVIDLEKWNRKTHFEFFYRMDYPQYNICMNIDITRFLQFVREHRLSFYYAMNYAVTVAANRCENFRYRIRENKTVVLHDKLHPSFTDMDANSPDGLFKMITADMYDDIFEFVEQTKAIAQNQQEFIDLDKLAGRDDFLFNTSIPWISFTHVSHTISLNRNDSVPRISWGKYFEQDGKVLMPFSVQVHHALVDGIHVGEYVKILQAWLDEER